MRKRIDILIYSSVLLLLFACVRELPEMPEEQSANILTAEMEYRPATKTILSQIINDQYYPLWAESDTIAVFTNPGQFPTAFRLLSGAGGTEGVFEGPLSGDRHVALFPFAPNAIWKDTQLHLLLPGQQKYHPDSFALDGFPMVAVNEGDHLQFKNLCSILRLSIRGSGVIESITLHSDDQFLSGPATVNLTFTDTPELVMSDGGSHDVRLECGAVLLNKDVPKDFYVVVPAGTYQGFSVIIDAFTTSVTKTYSNEITFGRSRLRPVSPFILEAPMIDLDNIPDNQIWYKTQNGKAFSPSDWESNPPFNSGIVSNKYEEGYGVILLDAPLKEIYSGALNAHNSWSYSQEIVELHLPDCVEKIDANSLPFNLDRMRIPSSIKSIDVGNLDRINTVYGPATAGDGCSVVSNGILVGVSGGHPEDYSTPDGVHTIGHGGCYGEFNKIIVSEGVRFIEEGAFEASSIKEIYFPDSVEKIGYQLPIYNLTGFYGSSQCTTDDHHFLISPRDNNLVCIVRGGQDEVAIIPDGVKYISSVFMEWPNLKRVILPNSLLWFSFMGIFVDCPNVEGFGGDLCPDDGRSVIRNGELIAIHGANIKEYTTPSGVYSIEMSCLYKTTTCDIENLTVSEGVRKLYQYCFDCSASLRSVTLPTTINEIGNCLFDNDINLESVYLPVRVPPVVLGGPAYDVLPKLKVFVPEESYDAYMADSGWQGRWGQYLTPYHFDCIDPPTVYESVDYSKDGEVTVLQTASTGKGIDLVLIGDAFSDRMIADGSYLSAMEYMKDAFFELEPYKSFQHLFNVYAVNVVSSSEDYLSGVTPLKTVITNNGEVIADYEACISYATKAIPDSRLDEATIIMVCNTPGRNQNDQAGTCAMMTRSTPTSDYGTGLGIAMFSYPWESALVQHEAGGHGFAKLADEYIARAEGLVYTIPDEEKESLREKQKAGWWKNIDFLSDPSLVRWSHFLSDSRYEKEYLGVFEGALMYYSKGVFRSSEYGMMNDNAVGFNAPSREAIYYRIHKLAYGDEWQYDYEEFVKWDKGSGNIRPTSMQTFASGKKNYEVRDPLPVTKYNPDEWTVTVMK